MAQLGRRSSTVGKRCWYNKHGTKKCRAAEIYLANCGCASYLFSTYSASPRRPVRSRTPHHSQKKIPAARPPPCDSWQASFAKSPTSCSLKVSHGNCALHYHPRFTAQLRIRQSHRLGPLPPADPPPTSANLAPGQAPSSRARSLT